MNNGPAEVPALAYWLYSLNRKPKKYQKMVLISIDSKNTSLYYIDSQTANIFLKGGELHTKIRLLVTPI